jgi:hypothetical protein
MSKYSHSLKGLKRYGKYGNYRTAAENNMANNRPSMDIHTRLGLYLDILSINMIKLS